jgi:hypothetical protein
MSDKLTIAPPRRSWPSFSLRTLFLLTTVVACWLGWQAKIVAERKSAMEIGRIGWEPDVYGPDLGTVRRWMGDYPIREFFVFEDQISAQEIERIRAAFPEAKLEPMRNECPPEEQYSPPPPPPVPSAPARSRSRSGQT